MDHVESFVSELVEILDHPPGREELALILSRKVSALVGRLGVIESGFAPREDVAAALREARARIAQRVITGDQSGKHLVLMEIDKVLAVVGKSHLLPLTLIG